MGTAKKFLNLSTAIAFTLLAQNSWAQYGSVKVEETLGKKDLENLAAYHKKNVKASCELSQERLNELFKSSEIAKFAKCMKSQGTMADADCAKGVVALALLTAANKKCAEPQQVANTNQIKVSDVRAVASVASTSTASNANKIDEQKRIEEQKKFEAAKLAQAAAATSAQAADKAKASNAATAASTPAKTSAPAATPAAASSSGGKAVFGPVFCAGPSICDGSEQVAPVTYRWQIPKKDYFVGTRDVSGYYFGGLNDNGNDRYEQPTADCNKSTDGQLIAVDYGEKYGKQAMVCAPSNLGFDDKAQKYIDAVAKADPSQLKSYVAVTKAVYKWVTVKEMDAYRKEHNMCMVSTYISCNEDMLGKEMSHHYGVSGGQMVPIPECGVHKCTRQDGGPVKTAEVKADDKKAEVAAAAKEEVRAPAAAPQQEPTTPANPYQYTDEGRY